MRDKTGPQVETRQAERGQTLIMFALAAGVLFGFAAMAIDVGMILHERRVLQNAADAAALAGALELPDSAVLAGDQAKEWAKSNGIDLASGDQLDITVSPDNTSVTVEVRRETSFIFGRVLGLVSTEVRADATARVGSPLALSGILPFGVLESAVNYDGDPTTIKYDATNPSNGNFGPLRIDGDGSSILEQSIKHGTQNGVCAESQDACQDPTVPTQPGNVISATRDGLTYRFDNTSADCDDFTDVLIPKGDGTYNVDPSCNPFAPDSLRLVLIPVIDSFPNGTSQPITIKYFTAMFLNSMSQSKCTGNTCEITGTFVKTVFDPTSDATFGIYDPTSGIEFVRLVD